MKRWRMAAAGLASAAAAAACTGGGGQPEQKRFPVSSDYPPGVMERFSFTAGGGTGWRLSGLRTPNAETPWRVVVITGTPSWSEYWAPTLAAAPDDLQILVADRPGFALSEPREAAPDIAVQAKALAPMLDGPEGQKVVLLGQSYGAPVATLLAAARPDKVKALMLVSSFYGEWGPTAKRLSAVGGVVKPVLPRDLRNSLIEINRQKPQLPKAEAALAGLSIPVLVLHGDRDTFVPPAFAAELAARVGPAAQAETRIVAGGDHFLNACCVNDILRAAAALIARAEAQDAKTAGAAEAAAP